MRKFFSDFRDFAMRGNVLDMAVGIIIGSAFTAIVNSLVKDMIMPVIAFLTRGANFDSMAYKLAEGENGTINLGNFISAVISFFLIALVVFLMLRLINKAVGALPRKKHEETVSTPARKCPYCITEIAEEATRCPHCTSLLTVAEGHDQ